MDIAFTNGRVFLGDGQILANASVVVSQGKIKEILAADAPLPEGTTRIPIGDNTLFPGFIDCHVHMCMDASPDPMGAVAAEPESQTAIKATENARKTLAAGVTTVRDLGGRAGIDLVLRDAVARGLVKGPRILASGKLICMTGGHGWVMGREADGADEVRKATREQIKAGADQLKFMATGGVLTRAVEPGCTQLGMEEMAAGIAEAHKVGKKTSTHAMGSEGILNALRAGIDTVEHGIYLTDEIIALMVKNKTDLIPTVAAMHHITVQGTAAGIPAWAVEKNKIVSPVHQKNLKKAYDAGVTIGMGTDAGTPFNFHGKNLMEIPLMARHGISPMDALIAATSGAARVIGLEDEIGAIAPGMAADLVLVRGNPLEDLDVFFDPEVILQVMKAGQL